MNKFNITLNGTGAAITVNVEVLGGTDTEIRELFDSFHRLANDHVLKNHVKFVYVYISEPGPNKIMAIKTVRDHANRLSEKLGRAVLGSGLKEAKDIIESATPIRFPEEMELKAAMTFVADLKAAGCTAYFGDKRLQIMA